MDHLRSALFLDFDNVFSGLLKLDPTVAMSFAQQPQVWLERLASRDQQRRRWLVLRCYMNPSGSVPDPLKPDTRVAFFRFRSAFTDAGFEVVDCPRLSHTKNGADIRLVIDAVEALRAAARYDEFVIGSGDSDMTPLLIKLRADDRDVTLMSPSDSAVVMRSVADQLIGGEDLLELSDTSIDAVDATLDAAVEEQDADGMTLGEADAQERFGQRVADLYGAAHEPLNLSTLSSQLRAELGPVATETGWFGHGGFGKAIQSLGLPGLHMAGNHLWDDRRHVPDFSQAETVADAGSSVPPAVLQVRAVLKVPPLVPASWQRIYESLASYVEDGHVYNLTEMTKWTRDQLAAEGVPVNRQAATLVAMGTAYGGCPLYRQPPPGADEVRQAFVANLVERMAAADLQLSESEVDDVRSWFSGAPS